MKIGFQAVVVGAAMLLGACQMTGNPTADRAAIGAAGGAVLGQILGKDSEATLAGALIGGLAGGATAPRAQTATPRGGAAEHPCQDIVDQYSDPEVIADLCYYRTN